MSNFNMQLYKEVNRTISYEDLKNSQGGRSFIMQLCTKPTNFTNIEQYIILSSYHELMKSGAR